MSVDKEVVSELAKKVPIENVYVDALQPAAVELGTGLKNAIKLVLTPISALAWGYDKIAEYLDSAIPKYFETRNIGKEKIKSPDVALAIPAIEAMRYTRDEVRTMLLNLLGASMNEDTAEFVHPAFVEIIKQMTPDEARVLHTLPDISLCEPIVDITIRKPLTAGDFTLFCYIGVLGEEAKCEYPEKISIYLTNLKRLGLVDIPSGMFLVDNWRYDKIKSSSIYLDKIEEAKKFGNVSVVKKAVGLTELGADLRKVLL